MKIGILGTGTVGQTLGTKLVELGHEVTLGSRTAGNEKALAWVNTTGACAHQGTFEQAAQSAEIIFNATLGTGTLEALAMAKEVNLGGKVLIDITNPLDFSNGMPPSLFVSNTDSLGEQIQRRLPSVKVVKALNTMWCGLMVNPRMLPDTHHTFIAGNDAGAKEKVKELLKSFGWREEEILDLGDITQSRGLEAWLPLWLRIWGATGKGAFNLKLVSVK